MRSSGDDPRRSPGNLPVRVVGLGHGSGIYMPACIRCARVEFATLDGLHFVRPERIICRPRALLRTRGCIVRVCLRVSVLADGEKCQEALISSSKQAMTRLHDPQRVHSDVRAATPVARIELGGRNGQA